MKSFRICFQNVRKWGSNNRIKMVMVFAIMCVFLYTSGIGELSDSMGMKCSPWIFPFLFTYRYMKIAFMLPLIFLFCDAPFIDANQVYVMVRTKRKVWCAGQMLYIFFTSFVYAAVLLLSTIIVNINHIAWNQKWGEVLGTAGTTNALQKLGVNYNTVQVIGLVIKYYTPAQAMFFSFLLMFLSFVFLGMIIYVVNVLSKSTVAGSVAASVLIIMTALVDGYASLVKFSPVSWNSLNNVDVGGYTILPHIEFILTFYIVTIIVCIIISLSICEKQEIVVRKER